MCPFLAKMSLEEADVILNLEALVNAELEHLESSKGAADNIGQKKNQEENKVDLTKKEIKKPDGKSSLEVEALSAATIIEPLGEELIVVKTDEEREQELVSLSRIRANSIFINDENTNVNLRNAIVEATQKKAIPEEVIKPLVKEKEKRINTLEDLSIVQKRVTQKIIPELTSEPIPSIDVSGPNIDQIFFELAEVPESIDRDIDSTDYQLQQEVYQDLELLTAVEERHDIVEELSGQISLREADSGLESIYSSPRIICRQFSDVLLANSEPQTEVVSNELLAEQPNNDQELITKPLIADLCERLTLLEGIELEDSARIINDIQVEVSAYQTINKAEVSLEAIDTLEAKIEELTQQLLISFGISALPLDVELIVEGILSLDFIYADPNTTLNLERVGTREVKKDINQVANSFGLDNTVERFVGALTLFYCHIARSFSSNRVNT
jgi:hypothetical protein